MKDYEQLYYDEIYKNKKLLEEIENLKQELEIYKSSNSGSIKSVIIDAFIKYTKKERK